jgi:hypothetical protein
MICRRREEKEERRERGLRGEIKITSRIRIEGERIRRLVLLNGLR